MLRIPARTPATTRDMILDAAGRMLGRLGYHKTTMDDMSREAGVARRTIYLHFESKDDIFLARIDRVVERLLSELRRIASTDAAAPERIRSMLLARVLFRFDTIKDYHTSLDEIFQSLRKPYLERRDGYFASEAVVFAGVLDQGSREGAFACADVTSTSRALVNATNGLLPYSLTRRELGSRRELELEVAALSDLLLAGLEKRRR